MATLTDRQLREKIASRDVESLSDAELVALVLSGGSSGNSVEVAEKILDERPLKELSSLPLPSLRMTGGMGIKGAVPLAAAFELGRRVRTLESVETEVIQTSDDLRNIFEPMLSSLNYEEFWIVYLNSANRILEKNRVSQGGVQGTVVDHKIIVKRAVELLATGIVLVHNHPSGVAEPSPEDIALTGKVSLAASLFDIQILDHLIITKGSAFSFRAAKLL